MSGIVNQAGEPISNLSMSGRADSEVAASLRVIGRSGYFLSASSENPGVEVWGKAEAGDTFQNLETDPLDSTLYDGIAHVFLLQIRIAFDVDAGTPPGPIPFQFYFSP